VTLAIAACRPPAGAVEGTAGAQPKDELAALTAPPTAASAAALARVTERARAADTAAAWARIHYLLDLFDDARFRQADDSLALLAAEIGQPQPVRGAATTDAAVAHLLVEVDGLLTADSRHPGARAARTLLELDQDPPTRRGDVFQRMVELKTVARGGGALADNARLRLFGFCQRALSDALGVSGSLQQRMIQFCLYPLFDSDPEPYFAADPALRPPPPRVADLAAAMARLIAPIGHGGRRLAVTGRALLADFHRERATALPETRSPADLGVPMVARAAAFDATPLLALGDGRGVLPSALAELLRPALRGDGRGIVAVALAATAAADALTTVAGTAAETGAHRLELVVGYRQELTVPLGDYWAAHAEVDVTAGGRTTLPRLGVIPLSLARLQDAAGLPPGHGAAVREADPTAGWDPRRAMLGLTLVVGGLRWRLVAPSGAVAEIATESAAVDPGLVLRQALGRVRGAFPDEDGLAVVIEPGVTYGQLIGALDAASRDANGEPLFARLALATTAPPAADPRGPGLARRIERRWRARVSLAPASLGPRAAVVRRCYQDLLETNANLGGEVRLELRGRTAVVVSGPRNRALRRCVLGALAESMAEQTIASATVTLAPTEALEAATARP
jgi:hypothetical protein